MSPNRQRAAGSLLGLNGRPIVVTAAGAADFLPATPAEITKAIRAAGLPPWGVDAAGRKVYRLRELERLFGIEAPPQQRGQGWRATPIPGLRGDRHRGRVREPEPVEDLAAIDAPAWPAEEASG